MYRESQGLQDLWVVWVFLDMMDEMELQVYRVSQGLLEDLEGYAKENPLPTLAVTLGVGLVLGLLMFGGRRR